MNFEKEEKELAMARGASEEEYQRERNQRIKQLGLPDNATDEQINLAFEIMHREYVHSKMIEGEISFIRKQLHIPADILDETIMKIVLYSDLPKIKKEQDDEMEKLKDLQLELTIDNNSIKK